MARHPDWEARLSAYLASVTDAPHAYGLHDCVLHGARAEEALTGEDRAAAFRGRYKTELGAKRVLTRMGFRSIEALLDHHLPPLAPALAQRGDPVLANGAVGVCIGTDAVFVGQHGEREGLVRVPRRDWQRAWAIR